MPQSGSRREDAFVFRIWNESRPRGGEDSWRAVVQHVASGDRRYCTNFVEMVEFVQSKRR